MTDLNEVSKSKKESLNFSSLSFKLRQTLSLKLTWKRYNLIYKKVNFCHWLLKYLIYLDHRLWMDCAEQSRQKWRAMFKPGGKGHPKSSLIGGTITIKVKSKPLNWSSFTTRAYTLNYLCNYEEESFLENLFYVYISRLTVNRILCYR